MAFFFLGDILAIFSATGSLTSKVVVFITPQNKLNVKEKQTISIMVLRFLKWLMVLPRSFG